MVHDLQIFRNTKAFEEHADMKNEEIKGLLMNWASHWEEKGVKGQAFGDAAFMIKEMTEGFGAKFDIYTWADKGSGKISLLPYEFHI